MENRHPGYDDRENYGFCTKRNLLDYSKAHQIDFEDFVRKNRSKINSVMDLGCGNGYFLGDLKKLFPEIKVLGADLRRYDGPLGEREFIIENISELSVPDNSADMIVSLQALQWIRDDKIRAYQEMNRVLRRDGFGFILPLTIEPYMARSLFKDRKCEVKALQNPKFSNPVLQLVLGDVKI